jgi:hypothetical protein
MVGISKRNPKKERDHMGMFGRTTSRPTNRRALDPDRVQVVLKEALDKLRREKQKVSIKALCHEAAMIEQSVDARYFISCVDLMTAEQRAELGLPPKKVTQSRVW